MAKDSATSGVHEVSVPVAEESRTSGNSGNHGRPICHVYLVESNRLNLTNVIVLALDVVAASRSSFALAAHSFARVLSAFADCCAHRSTSRFDGSSPADSRMLTRQASATCKSLKRQLWRRSNKVPNASPGHLLGAPLAGHARGSRRTVVQHEAAVALVHDLSIIRHFSDVRTVIVESHVANQQHFAVLDVTGERTVDCNEPMQKSRSIHHQTARDAQHDPQRLAL